MKTLILSLSLSLLLAAPALAETHEVHMLNRGETGPMVYEPAWMRVAPGDVVRFVPTQPSHNAATIDGMIPEGATPFKSRINQPFEVVLTVTGAYGIKCSPHIAMGMVMLIEVGDAGPVTLPEGLPAKAAARFRTIIAERP